MSLHNRVPSDLLAVFGPVITSQDRWLSSYSQGTQRAEVWTDPGVGSFNSVDANLQRFFTASGIEWSAYVTVQNALNAKPDVVPSPGSAGLIYPCRPGRHRGSLLRGRPG